VPKQLSSTTSLNTGRSGLRLKLEYVPIDSLKTAERVLRHHKRRQIKQIGRSLQDHGFLVPLVVRKDNTIVTGNARFAAAKLIGLREVPIIRAEHLNDEELRLLAIADNKLAEGVEWDLGALAIEFAEISLEAPELDQDRSAFSITERDIVFGRCRTEELGDLDDAQADDGGSDGWNYDYTARRCIPAWAPYRGVRRRDRSGCYRKCGW